MACEDCGSERDALAGRCPDCGWNADKVERQCVHCGRLVLLKTGLPVTAGIGAGLPAFLAYRIIGKLGVLAISTFVWAASFFFSAFTVRHACSICGRDVARDALNEDERTLERAERLKMMGIAGCSAVACLAFSFAWLSASGLRDTPDDVEMEEAAAAPEAPAPSGD